VKVCGTYKTATGNVLLVPAGKPVDTAIESLPYLDKGDILIDGGNTYFTILTADLQHYRPKGFTFFGMGISGGEKEHDLVLALCLAVIKKPMKATLSLNP
jgi:6-phosphogluconate dehydrogenase